MRFVLLLLLSTTLFSAVDSQKPKHDGLFVAKLGATRADIVRTLDTSGLDYQEAPCSLSETPSIVYEQPLAGVKQLHFVCFGADNRVWGSYVAYTHQSKLNVIGVYAQMCTLVRSVYSTSTVSDWTEQAIGDACAGQVVGPARYSHTWFFKNCELKLSFVVGSDGSCTNVLSVCTPAMVVYGQVMELQERKKQAAGL